MGILESIINGILITYWAIFEEFASLADAYTNVANANWLTTLSQNLSDMCVNTLMPAFSGVGLAIAATYFLISIISLVAEDRLTPEFLAKFFAKLAISVAVIMWSDTILLAIIDFGDAMGNIFVNWTGSEFLSNSSSSLSNEFSRFARIFMDGVEADYGFEISGTFDSGFSWSEGPDAIGTIFSIGVALSIMMSSLLLTLISGLATPLMSGVVYFVEISRTLELYIRGSLLPIAAGVMADDGWKGAGGRYIKKILALATQKVVLSLTCVLTSSMAINYLIGEMQAFAQEGTLEFVGASLRMVLMALVITMAGLSFMFKSLQVVNDLWGAS